MTQDKEQAPSMTWGLTWLITILFFTAGVLSPDVSAGPLYRWVDEKGVTHVTDSPPERPAGQEQVTEITPEAAGRPRGNADASHSKEFVARSSQWLKDPSLISDTVITIRPVKDKTYWLAMQNRGNRRGDGDGLGHSVFMMCVLHHFATSRGYNGWREAVGDAVNSGSAKKEKNEFFFTLMPSGPEKHAGIKETCRKFIRPQYLWDDVEVTVDTNKPVCRKLVRILADGELNARKKAYDKNNRSNIFEFSVDVDGDGRKDRITETITGERTHLSVKLATGKGYTLDEDGYVSLVNLNGKEHALVNYVKWDRDRKRGHTTGRRLYELTKDRAKLVCDREDLKELLQ
jgi:hypothetical protein